MIGPLIVGTVGVLGIFAAVVWFCWWVGRIRSTEGAVMPEYQPGPGEVLVQLSRGEYRAPRRG